jgi:hypothetical protein
LTIVEKHSEVLDFSEIQTSKVEKLQEGKEER